MKKTWIAAGIVLVITAIAVGTCAYYESIQFGYARVTLAQSGTHRHTVQGRTPLTDSYLEATGWTCVATHRGNLNQIFLRCHKGEDLREISTECDGTAHLHIDKAQLHIEVGCFDQEVMD